MRAKRREAVEALVDFVHNEYTPITQALHQAAEVNDDIVEQMTAEGLGALTEMFKQSADRWRDIAVRLETIYNNLPDEMEW